MLLKRIRTHEHTYFYIECTNRFVCSLLISDINEMVVIYKKNYMKKISNVNIVKIIKLNFTQGFFCVKRCAHLKRFLFSPFYFGRNKLSKRITTQNVISDKVIYHVSQIVFSSLVLFDFWNWWRARDGNI